MEGAQPQCELASNDTISALRVSLAHLHTTYKPEMCPESRIRPAPSAMSLAQIPIPKKRHGFFSEIPSIHIEVPIMLLNHSMSVSDIPYRCL